LSFRPRLGDIPLGEVRSLIGVCVDSAEFGKQEVGGSSPTAQVDELKLTTDSVSVISGRSASARFDPVRLCLAPC
jgi:hypothetical protein